MTSLDLALIGNSSVAALVDANGTIVWSCLPRFDSDAVFCALLREGRGADDYGFFDVELTDFSPQAPRVQNRSSSSLPAANAAASGVFARAGIRASGFRHCANDY